MVYRKKENKIFHFIRDIILLYKKNLGMVYAY